MLNKGFDPQVIAEYRAKMEAKKQNYLLIESEDNSDDYKNFYFIGSYEGKEVIYDAVIYTLSLHYESEIYELAEERTARHFPNKKVEDEEFDLYMAEVMSELEDEGEVKVSEHIEVDPYTDFGVSLDVALNVEQVSPEVISTFVNDYNKGELQLDQTLYSFEADEEDATEE